MGSGENHALAGGRMSPAARDLLAALRDSPLPNDDVTDQVRAALRELYELNFVNLYEPAPFTWRPTSLGQKDQ